MSRRVALSVVERIDHMFDIHELPISRDQLLDLRDDAANEIATLRSQLGNARGENDRLERAVTLAVAAEEEIRSRLDEALRENADLKERVAAGLSDVVRLRLELFNAFQDRKSAEDVEGNDASVQRAADAAAAFGDLKRAFAKRFHPNANVLSDVEKVQRAEMFKEFWVVIKSVEERHFGRQNFSG